MKRIVLLIYARLKIIRDESIGYYSWDNKLNGSGSSTSDYGSNDWSDSALQIVLNSGAYWNRTSGNCPYRSGATTTCDFSSNGLSEEAKMLIDDAIWSLGGVSTYANSFSTFYEFERGAEVYNERPVEWIGKVGLMYPSDYGHATSGGNITTKDTCLENLSNWSDYEDCNNNNWMYTDSAQWTLTPHLLSGDNTFNIYFATGINLFRVNNWNNLVSPVVYLSSDVKRISGDGSESDPFLLSL